MLNKSNKIKVAKLILSVMLINLLCSSCKLFPTQDMIDNIIPDYESRTYTVADLLPYDYNEIKNARALYSKNLYNLLNDYEQLRKKAGTFSNLDKDRVLHRRYLSIIHNYEIVQERYNMYVDATNVEPGTSEKLRDEEYQKYYDLKDADSAAVIKKYNNGKIDGFPNISIKAVMATATMSSTDDIYSEVECEIYEQVIIDNKEYNKLKIGDKIKLTVPATNSTVNCMEKYEVECTYIATDSLLYKNKNNEDSYFFIAGVEGTSDYRRVLNYYGDTLETYVGNEKLHFMKYARVIEANELYRLLQNVANPEVVVEKYNFDELVEKALCGGYLTYKYKDYVYANSITTNLKGYITSLTNYTNQRIDIEYYNQLNN